MRQALLDNSNVEVFLEGGRARNGRPMPPKMGLFSAVLEAIWEGIIDDALLVPVGISYDAIPETSYPAELLGTPKTTESFWMAIRGFFTAFRRDYGHVYVDFGAPVSARAFLAMHQEHKDAVLTSMSLRDIVSVGASMGAPAVALTANLASSAQAVRDLGSLMLRHARDVAVVTDVGIVALLLTTLHRGGASRAVLRRDFAWLRDIIEDRGYTTSARMRRSADEAFDRAVATLGRHLLLDSADVDFVQMPLLLEQRLHVSFYANQSSHPLVPEALLLTTAMTFESDAFGARAPAVALPAHTHHRRFIAPQTSAPSKSASQCFAASSRPSTCSIWTRTQCGCSTRPCSGSSS